MRVSVHLVPVIIALTYLYLELSLIAGNNTARAPRNTVAPSPPTSASYNNSSDGTLRPFSRPEAALKSANTLISHEDWYGVAADSIRSIIVVRLAI